MLVVFAERNKDWDVRIQEVAFAARTTLQQPGLAKIMPTREPQTKTPDTPGTMDNPTPPPSPSTVAQPTAPPTPASITASTTPPPPLLCSVSETAALAAQYPDDNLCDILMYTHVYVDSNSAVAVDDVASFETFTKVCGSLYKMTTCGLSFDSRFITSSKLSNAVWKEVVALRQSNVMHFGVLNLYDAPGPLFLYAVNIEPVLKKVRTLTSGTKTRIILGIGFFDYHEKDSWLTLKALVFTSNPKDIVVFITCVLTVPSSLRCIAMPPTVMRSTSEYPPALEKALPLALDSFRTSSEVVAFSFQMGTVIYNMTEKHGSALDALYKECNSSILGDQSQTCESAATTLKTEVAPISITTVQQRTLFYSYETVQTMKEKAEYVMAAKNRRAKFTWFLFNVHLTDISKKCHPNGPFERLKEFRKFYYDISQQYRGG
ncbi:hypothetical protein HPB49_021041 [Dermacentor silvarum]|uniref:Uncharacterized protein n=1 Tax=Dermacentor silvarum TaxID=543639 RepID=A0ACB8CHJ0_DERSI|nr:hypothetical protein HPB49_021041 [Dermacentor silvarum]